VSKESMQPHEHEYLFVNTFVLRKRRERIFFELQSSKKRGKFFNRLCHTYFEVLDRRFCQKIPSSSQPEDIIRILTQRGAPRTCYVISSNSIVDQNNLLLTEVIEQIFWYGLPTIIICIPGHLAYFEAEQEHGSPPRYILEK
jgi:hypothetical protein